MLAYHCLLKNELLGADIDKIKDPQCEDRRMVSPQKAKRNLFQYQVQAKRPSKVQTEDSPPYSLSPVGNKRWDLDN